MMAESVTAKFHSRVLEQPGRQAETFMLDHHNRVVYGTYQRDEQTIRVADQQFLFEVAHGQLNNGFVLVGENPLTPLWIGKLKWLAWAGGNVIVDKFHWAARRNAPGQPWQRADPIMTDPKSLSKDPIQWMYNNGIPLDMTGQLTVNRRRVAVSYDIGSTNYRMGFRTVESHDLKFQVNRQTVWIVPPLPRREDGQIEQYSMIGPVAINCNLNRYFEGVPMVDLLSAQEQRYLQEAA